MRLFSCIFAKSKTKKPAPVKSEIPNPSSLWANLPPDLLRSIAELLDLSSSARLSAVCTSWSHTIRLYLCSFAPFNLNQSIPLLLLSAHDSKINPKSTVLTFYDLTTNTSYCIPISIPSLHDHHWLGCNKGWLVTLDPQSQIHLIKPHTGAHLLLPHLLLPFIGMEKHPRKVILHHTPDDTDGCVAFCITKHEKRLFFLRSGAKNWAYIFEPALDVALYKGEIYVITPFFLHYLIFQGSSIMFRAFRLPDGFYTNNLFMWRGALLVLCTNQKPQSAPLDYTCIQVKLYKYNETDHDNRWSCVTSLGDDALFVGKNNVYAVSTSGNDSVCRNCIYFTDHLWHPIRPQGIILSKCYFGVYDLLMGTYNFRPLDSHTHEHGPIWFRPC